jgi:hypothetical protein
MDALRKVSYRAVQIPLDNVERFWRELEAFETSLNCITAKKFMDDLSPAHMQARTVHRQLVNYAGAIYPPNSPKIFLHASLSQFDASERALVGKWKTYLKWEESNLLEIEEKDRSILITRIQGVYRKAVIRMRYYTEIWFVVSLIVRGLARPFSTSGLWLIRGQTALESMTRPCLSSRQERLRLKSLGKTETQHSLMSTGTPQGTRQVASLDYWNKREDNGCGSGSGDDYPGNKRMRPSSPPRGADRDRETHWEGPSSRRRPFSPPPLTSSWDREDRPCAREPLPSRAQKREQEQPRQLSIPPVISWFVGDLPASSFDGHFCCFWRGKFFFLIGSVFRTDDLLNLFRNAVI